MGIRVGFISLGCPKNQVNGERMLAALTAEGMEIVDPLEGADALIINTCGFIDDAKREAIENILEAADLKKEGMVKAILVTGCLAESYREEILREIPEVDAVLGLGANGEIARYVREALAGEKPMVFPEIGCLPLEGERLLTSPAHWAYLQIAEGCSNRCTYCKIPAIRGDFRSRPAEEILREAEALAAGGVRELILIAQDTTRYGVDLYGELRLPALLRQLAAIEGVHWLRLLYCYPDAVTQELIDVIAEEPKVVKYIDLPMQHADDRILAAMGRRGTQAELAALLAQLRARVPGIAIRTTLLVGFPGEDDAAFDTLAAFVEEQRFDRLGVFAFSPQEGTPAFHMDDQVDPETAARRADILMEQQNAIAEAAGRAKIGQTIEVVVEDYDGYTDSYTGRSAQDAPEIDSLVYFTSPVQLEDGDFAQVKIFGVKEYDLLGEAVD
ncbi:MAG: 30S ribosomal protein S12 methylthiotransferase RimO [Oscillospiraceae bacterium]|jgi:ribosomal protein S12 methylthiotransferase|nr:30S ribosomal protein S12 methylthiotransferase RimO [Oscillospiraceae bacterium]